MISFLNKITDNTDSVIFSTWTKMLDLVEKALNDTEFQFQRIDGSKSSSHRKQALRIFKEDPSCTIFLATLGSAGVGYVCVLVKSCIR